MTKGEADMLVAALTADGYEAQAAKGGTGDHMWAAEVSGRTTVPADYMSRPWQERLMTLGEWNRRTTRPFAKRYMRVYEDVGNDALNETAAERIAIATIAFHSEPVRNVLTVIHGTPWTRLRAWFRRLLADIKEK